MKNYNFRFTKTVSLLVAVIFLFSSLMPQFSFAAKENAENLSSNALEKIVKAVPKSAGYVTKSNVVPGENVLVYIQDMHCNPGVQKNISKIIASLDENIGIDKIILEGVPEGKADIGLISAIPDTLKAKTVENLLERGMLTGVELYAVEKERDNIYGVENWDKYIENIYRAAYLIDNEEYVLSSLKDFNKQVSRKTKSKIGNISNLISGSRDAKWYSDLLSVSKEYKMPIYNYEFLGNYVDLKHTSQNLNTKIVTKEFDEYISELKNTLGYKDFQNLAEKASDQNAYFEELYNIVLQGDFSAFAQKYPNLYSFLAYSNKIKNTMPLLVYKDEEAYINAILDEASQQLETAKMIILSKMTLLLNSFIKTSMTEEEFSYFLSNLEVYKEIVSEYFPKYSDSVLPILNDNEYFLYYTTNILRNTYFSENLQNYTAQQKKNKVNVFVSGGFHSSVVDILTQNKISYVVISPVVSSAQLPDVYNQLISINSATSPKFSRSLMSNALSPIPLMLAANPLLPAENREAYFDILIKAVVQSAAFDSKTDPSGETYTSIEPQALKDILENWLYNVQNIEHDKISVAIDGRELKVTADHITLTYPIENGLISFSNRQVEGTADSPMFSVAYYAGLTVIKDLFLDFYDRVYKRALYEMLPIQRAKYMKVQDRYFSTEAIRDKTIQNSDEVRFSSFLDLLLKGKERNEFQVQHRLDNLLFAGSAKKFTIELYERKITFIVESSLADILTESDFEEMLKTAKGSNSINAIPETIVIATFDKSPNLFVDYMNKGVIGVNKALFDIDDNNLMKAMLKVGIVHELKHEFEGEMPPSTLDAFEEKLNLDDISMLLESMMDLYDIDENETIEQRQDRVKKDVSKKLSMVLDTSGKKSDNKFLRKISKYAIGIEAITELVNRKDMKRADLMHIITTYLNTDKYPIAIEEVNYNIAQHEKEIERLSAYHRDLVNNLYLITTPESIKRHEREIQYVSRLKSNYEEALIELKNELEDLKNASEKHQEIMAANQKYFFSNIRPSAEERANKPSFDVYMQNDQGKDNIFNKSGIIDQERRDIVDYNFNVMLDNFREMLARKDFSEDEINALSNKLKASCKSGIRLLYNALPEHHFRRYYSDKTVVHNHALLHSIEVLVQAIRIMEYDTDMLEGLKDGTFDLSAVAYAAMMHDISNILARPSHEKNSTYMIDSIFSNVTEGMEGYELDPEKGFNHIVYINPESGEVIPEGEKTENSVKIDVAKVKMICFGHKKIKPNKPTQAHIDNLEVQLIHDADGFSAIFDLQRIIELKFVQNEFNFKEDLTLKERVKLILENDYIKGDAINDHVRQGFYRKSAPFYASNGAKRLVETARNTALEELRRVLLDNTERIKMVNRIKTDTLTTFYSDSDIERMLDVIQEIVDALKKVEKDPDAINELDDRTKEEKISPIPTFEYRDMANIIKSAATGGTVRLPKFVVMSDIHGADRRFEFLLKDMLNIDQSEKLTPETLKKALDDSDIDNLFILGDLIDRGPGPLRVIELIRALMESEKTRYIIGNHDNNAQMNILGVHLPFYDNYKGIDDDYEVRLNLGGTERVINVSSMLRLEHKAEADMLAVRQQYLDAAVSNREREAIMKNYEVAGIKTKGFWAKKFEEYVAYSDNEQEKIWNAEKMRAAALFQEMYGIDKLDMETGIDILNYPNSYTAQNKVIVEDEALYEWWRAMLGHNVQTIVFKGLGAVNKMSLNWWIDKHNEMEILRQKYPEHEAYWKEMDEMLTTIISSIKSKIESEMENGNWAWLVVDSIMYRNFESTEWYAFDWVFHSGWGDMVKGLLGARKAELEEIARKKEEIANEKDKEARRLQSEASKLMTSEQKVRSRILRDAKEAARAAQRAAAAAKKEAEYARNQIITYSNYFEDSFIVELMEFYKNNFNLFTIDSYGGLHMHAILPIDEDGDVAIGYVDKNGKMHTHDEVTGKRVKGLYYKGEYYSGPSILEGLYKMSVDVKLYDYNAPLSEILEAFTLINSIYADNTVAIKPQEISQDVINLGKRENPNVSDEEALKIGFSIIAQKLGVPVIYAGHNTLSKLEEAGIGEVIFDPDNLPIIVNIDDDMSPKYGSRGSYKVISSILGILRAGFEGPKKGEKKYIQKELVKPSLFMEQMVKYAREKLLERQIYRIDNSIFINLSEGKGAMLSERSKLESLAGYEAETYNIEIVTNEDLFHGKINPDKFILGIKGLTEPVEVSVYESVTPTGVHLLQIVMDSDLEKQFQNVFYNQSKKVLLIAALKEFSRKHPDKKLFIHTDSTELFSKEVNSRWLEKVVFLKDRVNKDEDNVLMNITMLSEDVAEAISKTWGSRIIMEQIPLPVADTDRFEDATERYSNPSETIQSILSAA